MECFIWLCSTFYSLVFLWHIVRTLLNLQRVWRANATIVIATNIRRSHREEKVEVAGPKPFSIVYGALYSSRLRSEHPSRRQFPHLRRYGCLHSLVFYSGVCMSLLNFRLKWVSIQNSPLRCNIYWRDWCFSRMSLSLPSTSVGDVTMCFCVSTQSFVIFCPSLVLQETLG